jgi:hypothetical protein
MIFACSNATAWLMNKYHAPPSGKTHPALAMKQMALFEYFLSTVGWIILLFFTALVWV